MGRVATHTQEEVFAAADKLAAQGVRVTPRTLRDVLGGGSYSTLGAHIEAWEAQRNAAPAPVVLEMPPAVRQAFDMVWVQCSAEAGKEIASIREKADAEVTAVGARLDESLAEIVQLEQSAEDDAGVIEGLRRQVEADAQTLAFEKTEAAKREAALSAVVRQQQEQLDHLKGELQRLHAEHEAARQVGQAEAQRLNGLLEAGQERERALMDALAVQKAGVARLESQLQGERVQSEQTKRELQEAHAGTLSRLELERSGLADELRLVRSREQELAASLNQAQGELVGLRESVKTLSDALKVKGEAKQGKGADKP